MIGIFFLAGIFFQTYATADTERKPSGVIDSLEMELKKATDSVTIADVCVAICRQHKHEDLTFFSQEYNYLLRALHIYEKAGLTDKTASTCNSLGGIHYNRNQTDKARRFWQRALDLYTESGNKSGQGIMYNNLSVVLPAPQNEAYLLTSIQLREQLGDTMGMISCVHNLGSLYASAGKLAEAEKHYLKAIQLSQAVGSEIKQQSLYLWLGKLRQQQGRFEEGIQCIEKSIGFNLLREADEPNAILAYEALAELYVGIHDYKQAYTYQSKLLQLREGLYEEQHIHNIMELEAQYETEKKEEQIGLLKENEAITARELKAEQRQKLYLSFFSGIVALSLTLIVALYIQARKNKAKIEYQNTALLQLNRTKDRFFSIIAHDLRNPLVALSGLFKLIYHHATNSDLQKLNALEDHSNKSIAEVNHLLDNLLNWASSQTGTLPYRPEPLIVKQLYEELVTLFRQSAQAKQICLAYDLEEDLYVFADRNGLNVVLRNLISNAIKFTPLGGEATLSAIQENDNSIRLIIADSGGGMDQALLTGLFNGAEKPSTEGTQGEKGTGLGILLCREFIELNKGTIAAASEIDKGTTFYISLPAWRG